MKSAVASTPLDAFEADLTRGGIVTRVLEAWAGGPVRAEVLAGGDVLASVETRTRLGVQAGTAIRYRRVRLLCGERVLSEADNWFVPDRLTPEMRGALDKSDIPFGRVIAPLSPRRTTLTCERLAGDPLLRVRALVLAGDGAALAEVVEHYTAAIFHPR